MEVYLQTQIIIDIPSSGGANILNQMTGPKTRAHDDKVIFENNLDLVEVRSLDDRDIDGPAGRRGVSGCRGIIRSFAVRNTFLGITVNNDGMTQPNRVIIEY